MKRCPLPLRYCLCCFVLLYGITTGHAQTQLQDSLTVLRLFDSARNNWDTNTDKAMLFANQVLDFSKTKDYKPGIIKAYVLLGTVADRKGAWPQAITYYQQGATFAKQNKNDRELGVILYNMATTYFNLAAFDKSFEAGTAALNIKTALNDTSGIAKCYRVMAEIYSRKSDFKKATEYIQKAITIQRQLTSKRTLVNMLNSAGSIYMEANQNEKALEFLKEAESYITGQEGASVEQGTYNNIGMCYDRMGKADEAEQYYLLALESEYLDSEPQEVIILNNLGQIYLTKKKHGLAKKYLDQALELAKELNSTEDLANIHSNLADMYAADKNYEQAYKHRELYMVYDDSLMNAEKMKTIEELTIKFETKNIALKNKQLEEKVNEQKYIIVRNLFWLYGTLSIVGILALAAFFYTRQSRLKTSLQRLELEQQQYKAQMNPHFIFNCMNSIQHYIVHNEVAAANRYLSKFAELMRKTLDNSTVSDISLQEEISYLNNYLLLEKMRFEDKFVYEINCADNLNVINTKIMTMMIQPFVENAIQHGLRYLPDNSGRLTVHFEGDQKVIYCTIDDNGIGRAASLQLKSANAAAHKSHGMELVYKRIALANKLYKTNTTVTVTDKVSDTGKPTGTLVTIKYCVKQ